MPLTHIECCGQRFTIEEALGHLVDRRNTCQWTYELAAAMLQTNTAHPSHADGSRISTTVLTGKCDRRMVLERSNDYTVKLEDMYASFRGTMFHGQLENFAHPDSYGEARFHVKDLGLLIPSVKKALPRLNRSFSGSPDLVDPTVGILWDYKRTKEVPRFNQMWGDHAEQLNINRWLVDHADTVEHMGETFDMTDELVRKRFVPVEWQELVILYVDDKGPKPITLTKSIDVPTLAGGTKKARVPDVWDDARVEALIAETYIEARLGLQAGIAPIPPGWENQSHVLCGYCAVSDICAAREREGE